MIVETNKYNFESKFRVIGIILIYFIFKIQFQKSNVVEEDTFVIKKLWKEMEIKRLLVRTPLLFPYTM